MCKSQIALNWSVEITPDLITYLMSSSCSHHMLWHKCMFLKYQICSYKWADIKKEMISKNVWMIFYYFRSWSCVLHILLQYDKYCDFSFCTWTTLNSFEQPDNQSCKLKLHRTNSQTISLCPVQGGHYLEKLGEALKNLEKPWKTLNSK